MVLEQSSNKLKSSMGDSKTLSKDDMEWWGSNLCLLQGWPGTGKSRTIAALICTVLQKMEAPSSFCDYTGPPRILVVTQSSVAADELFLRVYNLLRNFFQQNTTKCQSAVRKMVRVGFSCSRELVARREVSQLVRDGRYGDVVDNATVVFTTATDLHRKGLQSCTTPFSLLVIDEACKLQNESLIQAACTAFVRKDNEQNFKRVSTVIVGDGADSLETTKENFFHRAVHKGYDCDLSLRISLSQQYRTAPPITKFLSSTFYGGKLSSPEKNGMPCEEDDIFKSLRSHKRCPIRNFVVIDTSLERKLGADCTAKGGLLFNLFESNLIVLILQAWARSALAMKDGTNQLHNLQKKITILCLYPQQRTELTRTMAKVNLSRIQVRTMDEMAGLENEIIFVSLVRTRSHGIREDNDIATLSTENIGDAQWIRFVASRARTAFIVVGNAKFMGEPSSHWAHLFRHCLSCVEEGDNATHGYFRPRYVDGKKDFRLMTFSPSYLQG